MALYAHVESGKAMDVQEDVSSTHYLRRFSGVNTSAWVVATVPAGTTHGAADNGNGTFTNVALPAPPMNARLQRGERLDLLNDVFAAPRLIAINTAFEAQTDPALVIARDRHKSETARFSRGQMVELFMALRQADVPTAGTKITVAEITAIANHGLWASS